MELHWGDDTVAIDAAIAQCTLPVDVIDAGTAEAAEVVALAGAGLFGARHLVVRNASALTAETLAKLSAAGGTTSLRVDGSTTPKFRKSVTEAGGVVTEHSRGRDVGAFATRYARDHGLSFSGRGRATLISACGADTALARSVLDACRIAGITAISERQVIALSGLSGSVMAPAVSAAVRSGKVADALAALAECGSDPHATLAAIRRALCDAPAVPDVCVQALCDAELRLRSSGRDAALWVCVATCAEAMRRP